MRVELLLDPSHQLLARLEATPTTNTVFDLFGSSFYNKSSAKPLSPFAVLLEQVQNTVVLKSAQATFKYTRFPHRTFLNAGDELGQIRQSDTRAPDDPISVLQRSLSQYRPRSRFVVF